MRSESRIYTLFDGKKIVVSPTREERGDMRPRSRVYTLFGGQKIVVSPNGFDRWGRARKIKTLPRP